MTPFADTGTGCTNSSVCPICGSDRQDPLGRCWRPKALCCRCKECLTAYRMDGPSKGCENCNEKGPKR